MISCVWLFATPCTRARQASLSKKFSRQEYWSGLPFLSSGIFPTQGSNPGLPHCRQTLYHLSHQGSLCNYAYRSTINKRFMCLWFPVAHMVKNSPARQETWLQSLSQEDPLEKWMATHFSILALRIPWTEEPGELPSMRSQRVGQYWATIHVCLFLEDYLWPLGYRIVKSRNMLVQTSALLMTAWYYLF